MPFLYRLGIVNQPKQFILNLVSFRFEYPERALIIGEAAAMQMQGS